MIIGPAAAQQTREQPLTSKPDSTRPPGPPAFHKDIQGPKGPMASLLSREKEYVHALLTLTLNPSHCDESYRLIAGMTDAERDEFVALADSHHVIIRALEPFRVCATSQNNSELERWAAAAIEKER